MLEELEEELSLPSNAGDSNEGVKMKLYLCDHHLATICKQNKNGERTLVALPRFIMNDN